VPSKHDEAITTAINEVLNDGLKNVHVICLQGRAAESKGIVTFLYVSYLPMCVLALITLS
jgi:hypothetical protein